GPQGIGGEKDEAAGKPVDSNAADRSREGGRHNEGEKEAAGGKSRTGEPYRENKQGIAESIGGAGRCQAHYPEAPKGVLLQKLAPLAEEEPATTWSYVLSHQASSLRPK